MSLDWIFWAIGIWFLIGAVCAGLVYQDQADRKVKGWKWPLLCIPLSVIGYYLYHSEKRQVRPTGRELPPRQHYPAPEYQFKEPPQEPEEAKTETDPLNPKEAACDRRRILLLCRRSRSWNLWHRRRWRRTSGRPRRGWTHPDRRCSRSRASLAAGAAVPPSRPMTWRAITAERR